jgi:hypothetical protein
MLLSSQAVELHWLNVLMSLAEIGVIVGVALEGTEYLAIHNRWPKLTKIGFLIIVLSLIADWRVQSTINRRLADELVGARSIISALTPRNLTFDQEKKLFELARQSKGVPATLLWPQADAEVNHIASQMMLALGPWKIQYVNAAFISVMIPGIQVRTSSGATKEQRAAASAIAEQLGEYLPNVSLSIDQRVTPTGSTDKDRQGALLITIGPLLFGSS